LGTIDSISPRPEQTIEGTVLAIAGRKRRYREEKSDKSAEESSMGSSRKRKMLLAMAISLAGASAGHLTLLIIAGLVAVSAAVGAIRFYLNRHPLPARLRLPDIAA
jgi:Flp pilus assembly protein TadB